MDWEKYGLVVFTAGLGIVGTIIGGITALFIKQFEERSKLGREKKMAASRAISDLLFAYRQLTTYGTQLENALKRLSEQITDDQAKQLITYYRSFMQFANTSSLEESLKVVASHEPNIAASIRESISNLEKNERMIDVMTAAESRNLLIATLNKHYPIMLAILATAIRSLCNLCGFRYKRNADSWLDTEMLVAAVTQQMDDIDNDPVLSVKKRMQQNQ